VTKTRREFR